MIAYSLDDFQFFSSKTEEKKTKPQSRSFMLYIFGQELDYLEFLSQI